jgi:hypothetical protein
VTSIVHLEVAPKTDRTLKATKPEFVVVITMVPFPRPFETTRSALT